MTKLMANGTAYELSGPIDAPAVVLIHGLGLSRHVWQWMEPELSSRYRILNFDLFGHGDSAPPPVIPTLTLFSEQLRDLLDLLGVERVAIVGFSLGGMINRRFALDHPDRIHALAILNSPHERDPEAQKQVEAAAANTAAGAPGKNLDAIIKRWFTPAFRNSRPDIIALVREWVLANDHRSYALCRRVLAFGVLELIRPTVSITSPTLVMTGENDSGSTPAMARAIAAEIAGAQAVIVPRMQHMGLVEGPALFTRPLLAFLDEVFIRDL